LMGSSPRPGWARKACFLGFFALFAAGPVAPAAGQGGDGCDVPRHQGLVMQTFNNISGEDRIFYFKSPTIRCPDGVTIQADSAVIYESTNYTQLLGNVVFSDPESRLTSDNAQYFSDQRRLRAEGYPVLTNLTDGSVIRGDQIILTRAGPQTPEDALVVTGRRPHATLYPTRAAPVEEPDTASAGGPEMEPDSAQALPDTIQTPPDTLQAPPLQVALDTLQEAPDTLQAVLDTLGVPEEEPPPTPLEARDAPEAQEEPEVDRVPYEIDATRFDLQGSRFFRATGSVVVIRDSLRAVADSLEYDQDLGSLFLSKEASVTMAQTDLAADSIRLQIPGDEVREAFATGNAVLEGEDLRLLAPFVTLFFTEGRMERLVAIRDVLADSLFAEMDEDERERERLRRGVPPLPAREMGFTEFPRRPYALAQDFALEGDSLEVLAPGEVLEEVKAMGRARGESEGRDSLNADWTPELISSDWLEGDTIVAFFREVEDSISVTVDPVSDVDQDIDLDEPPPVPTRGAVEAAQPTEADTTQSDYQLDRLLAMGGARSMYRMAPSDSILAEEGGALAVHYVMGDEITIILNSAGEAERMEVVGQTRGIHLEPIRGEVGIVDSLVVPDTVAVPDTAKVVGRGGRGG
jgi:lipopolysaccharide export system protein LptA